MRAHTACYVLDIPCCLSEKPRQTDSLTTTVCVQCVTFCHCCNIVQSHNNHTVSFFVFVGVVSDSQSVSDKTNTTSSVTSTTSPVVFVGDSWCRSLQFECLSVCLSLCLH